MKARKVACSSARARASSNVLFHSILYSWEGCTYVPYSNVVVIVNEVANRISFGAWTRNVLASSARAENVRASKIASARHVLLRPPPLPLTSPLIHNLPFYRDLT